MSCLNSIHKIAEEIFRAPTVEELADRLALIEKQTLKEMLPDNPQISKLVDLFAKGAHWIDWYGSRKFVYEKWKTAIEASVSHWQQAAKTYVFIDKKM